MERIFYIGIIFLSTVFSVQAKTIVIAPDNSKKALTQAILEAENGDTIYLKAGIYKEGAMRLEKAITLIGEKTSIIDGEDKYEMLWVEHDDVVIRGITFINCGTSGFNDIAALKINKSKNVTVENCTFENNFFGIHIMASNHINLFNNRLISGQDAKKSSANGIHCWKNNHLTIRGNYIEGHRDAIYLEFTTESLIENNESVNNTRYGLHFMFSHENLVQYNLFKNNGAGATLMYTKKVTATKNYFIDNWGSSTYGLLLKEVNDSHIYNNVFNRNSSGIYGEGANRIQINDNLFSNNGWAIKMNASSADATITHNSFVGNTFDFATNGNLKVKTMDGNYWDKYEGYDLNRDGTGDIPYRPITFYSIIIERNPGTLMLFRSFFVKLMDKAENAFPSITPVDISDNAPLMKNFKIDMQ